MILTRKTKLCLDFQLLHLQKQTHRQTRTHKHVNYGNNLQYAQSKLRILNLLITANTAINTGITCYKITKLFSPPCPVLSSLSYNNQFYFPVQH
jgi:hypothetical protein